MGPPQQQAVLAMLLLNCEHAVSMAKLVEALWRDKPPSRAVPTIRTYAWQLRRLLELDSTAPRMLVSVGGGYQMTVPGEALDVRRAESLLHEAVRARGEGRSEQADVLLGEALELWRGDPLAGVPGPFAERQRERLEELRPVILEERLDLAIARGQYHTVIPGLTELIASYPLRERPHALLMRALYATGRQTDALALFNELRHRLVEEQGVDPGADLLAVQRRILEGDPTLVEPPVQRVTLIRPPSDTRAARGAGTPQAAAEENADGGAGGGAPGDEAAHTSRAEGTRAVPVPAQLPPDLPDFTGRTAHVALLQELLTAPERATPPLVAITGMGGIGKTSLALHVAHRVRHAYPDGQLHANLHGSHDDPADPAAVLAGFLVACGVPAERVPERLDDRTKLFRSVLDGRRVLIVLDNARDAEHLMDLLPGSAGCGVIVTSRPRLFGAPLTFQLSLDVFSPGEALGLLGTVIGQQRLAAEHAQARKLVQACGYLPVAIRIVAARLAGRPWWRIGVLTARLADEQRRIAELHVGGVAVDAVFEVGYRQLTAEQARAFRLLAVVGAPDVSLATAAAMLAMDEDAAEELLESLVDAAMMESPRPGVYRYHDLVRVFARQHADDCHEQDEGDQALHRLLAFLLATACNAFTHAVPGDPVADALGPLTVPGLRFADVHEARAWIHDEIATITAAVLYAADRVPGKEPLSLRIAADLLIAVSPFNRDLVEGKLHTAVQAVLRAAERVGDPRTIGRARLMCSTLELHRSRPDAAERHARAAMRAARRAHDIVITRQALNDLGLALQYERRYDEAVACYDEAIDLARELGHQSGEAVTTINAALARVRSGQADQAIPACETALERLDAVGDRAGTAYAQYVLGMALHEQRRYDEALARYAECLAVCRSTGARDREAYALYRLAETLRVTGRLNEAARCATNAAVQCEEIGSVRDHAHALVVLGRVQADLGQHGQARSSLERARALFADLRLPESAEVERMLSALSREPRV